MLILITGRIRVLVSGAGLGRLGGDMVELVVLGLGR